MEYNIKKFGAMGDGINDDTAAVQSTIDKCDLNGGGTVLVPAGIYLCGTIYLRNNIYLHIDSGAVIRANPEANWNAPGCFEENKATVCEFEKADGRHLIIAYKVKNVSITGRGTIDGNYSLFFGELNAHGKRTIIGTRPSQMIFFCDCEDVSLRDSRLINSCYWTLLIYGCRNVQIDGLYVKTAAELWSCDGLDIDSSQNVCVSNCIIDTEDDCITLRCNNKYLKEPRDCENITVVNCHLRSSCTKAVRVGVGDGAIKNALFSNIMMKAKCGIAICGRYSDDQQGTAAENIIFSNVNIDSNEPFFISCGYKSTRKCSKIVFSDMQVRARGGSYVGGMPDNITEDIVFKNIAITMVSGLANQPDKLDLIDAIWGQNKIYYHTSAGAPFAFWLENVRNCRFTDCSIKLEDNDDFWLNAVRMKNTENVDISSLKLEGFEKFKTLTESL